ncbi:MAG TPA: TetR family transcriptional regulator [Solirubrobacteraceae bacterium]|nr:TetR family transcriptional regulator [Solirubrobacteraceae bacterium]
MAEELGGKTAPTIASGAPEHDSPEHDALDDDPSSEARIHKLLASELGEQTANAFAKSRLLQERVARRNHADEGLRERKKRLTRQRISDVATALFVVRGFEHVTVAEIARIVGVSEKTVFNYFPTKESLVFDRADEGIERLATALKEREPGESPTKAMLRALSSDPEELTELPDEIHMFMPLFSEMVASTPSLRAAWLELHDRLVEVATRELAALADVDPRDPEPIVAARAIVGLLEVDYISRIRHIEAGLRGAELHEAVVADLERGARMLDTGLWSFGLLTQGARTRAQVKEAADAAEAARAQVVSALRQARAAWRERRRPQQRKERKGMQDDIKQAVKQAAKDAAFEAFRQMLGERHEAIRAREQALRDSRREGGRR